MDVILLEKTQNLGNLGDMVTVRPGYGRNYLIPSGKAVSATEENRKKFEERRAELELAASDALTSAGARKEALENISIVIHRKAGEQGKLYGSVGTVDIAETVSKTGVSVEKSEVRLPEGPLRTIGDYKIDLQLHPEVVTQINVCVAEEE